MDTDDPKKIARGFLTVTSEAFSRMALDVVDELLELTPVDTGWARANWVPSIGQPISAPAGSPDDVSAAAASQQRGQAEVVNYDLGQGPIFISNHVSYITHLNDGSSQQAPAGFVEIAIDTALAKTNGRGNLE